MKRGTFINGLLSEIASEAKAIRLCLGDAVSLVRSEGSPVDVVVECLMHRWLKGWFKMHDVAYAVSDSTQMPPDFYLSPSDKTRNLLEVKAFYRKRAPGFDIADFKAYEEEIIDKPYMLDADYLIFGYDMDDAGVVTIRDLWLKKVWEITRPMEGWALNLQKKRKIVHKIRPGKWFATGKQKYRMFDSKEAFLAAIEETVYQNVDTHDQASSWRTRFLKSYKAFYGKSIAIPHWHEIAADYIVQ